MNEGAGPTFDQPGYDVIGDVHGHVEQLEKLLTKLGYATAEGDDVYRHPKRTAVFVGDLIDYNPEATDGPTDQLATIRLVKSMVDGGSARIVIGNHEFNAVAYATIDHRTLDYCRPHSPKNVGQHREFIAEVGFGSSLHDEIIDWFSTLPLWLDLGGLRVVHACWSQDDIEHLASVLDGDGSLNEVVVRAGSTKGTRTYEAIENVLKGPEVRMAGYFYFDRGGDCRKKARANWWDADAQLLPDVAIIPGGTQLYDENRAEVKTLPAVAPTDAVPRYTDDVPVIVGHYWNSGEFDLEHEHVACVDYSAGRGGPLVAYRWSGERTLKVDHLVRTD